MSAHVIRQQIITPANNGQWAMLNRLNFEGIISNEGGKYFVKEPKTLDHMISVVAVHEQFRKGLFGHSLMTPVPFTFVQQPAEPVVIRQCPRRRHSPLDSPRRLWVTRPEC